jgi:hypothetical protein
MSSPSIQTVKLLQNMIANRTTYCLRIQDIIHTRKKEVEPERKLEGQQFTKLLAGSKVPT